MLSRHLLSRSALYSPALAILILASILNIGRTGEAQARVVLAPPIGILQLCYHNPSLCQPHTTQSARSNALDIIARTNIRVNHGIMPKLDAATATATDWELVAPNGAGDCKDYTLTKLFVLSWIGVPAGAMRIAVVHVPNTPAEVSHAILIVRVADQDLVLDNLTDKIVPLSESSYGMEAVEDPQSQAWVSAE